MKTLYFSIWVALIVLLKASSYTFSQGNCVENAALIDSVYYYTWNSESSVWEQKSIQRYYYNPQGKVHYFESIEARSLMPQTNRTYTYDQSGTLLLTLSQRWQANHWQNVQNVFYSNAPNGADRYETIYNWVNNDWKLQSRSVNYYENGLRIGYTAQLLNKNNQFYDYANYFISYTEFNKIKEWYGQKISDGSLLFNRIYHYNEKNNLFERHIYTPIAGSLINYTKPLFL
ncbi:MAG: hypothetical protein KGZ97_10795 [Bacteroidetes bacterium]|nr:hypothetical protein [Bacteroidota bacterium]